MDGHLSKARSRRLSRSRHLSHGADGTCASPPQAQPNPRAGAGGPDHRRRAHHPVADFARLFLLETIDVNWVTGAGADELAEVGTEILLESTDPLVLDAAALKLAAASGGTGLPLSGQALHELARIHDEMKRGLRGSLAEVGLRAALALEDVALAERWAVRFEDALAARDCVEGPPGMCEGYRRELMRALGWVAAERGEPGVTWAADLHAAALRCALANEIPDPALTGEGTFSAEWQWAHWSAPGVLSTCIASADLQGPQPDEGQRVVVHVFKARPR